MNSPIVINHIRSFSSTGVYLTPRKRIIRVQYIHLRYSAAFNMDRHDTPRLAVGANVINSPKFD